MGSTPQTWTTSRQGITAVTTSTRLIQPSLQTTASLASISTPSVYPSTTATSTATLPMRSITPERTATASTAVYPQTQSPLVGVTGRSSSPQLPALTQMSQFQQLQTQSAVMQQYLNLLQSQTQPNLLSSPQNPYSSLMFPYLSPYAGLASAYRTAAANMPRLNPMGPLRFPYWPRSSQAYLGGQSSSLTVSQSQSLPNLTSSPVPAIPRLSPQPQSTSTPTTTAS